LELGWKALGIFGREKGRIQMGEGNAGFAWDRDMDMDMSSTGGMASFVV